jgi:hypothetical protein
MEQAEQPEAMNGLESNQADVAQLVEQPIRNRQVSGSSPLVGSIPFSHIGFATAIVGVQEVSKAGILLSSFAIASRTSLSIVLM